MDELFLCKPCMSRLPAFQTVKSVSDGVPAKGKGTCELYGLRKFGYICTVEFQEPITCIIAPDLSDFPQFKPIKKGAF